MKYASDLYEKAEQTLAQRRQKALLDWQQNRRKLAEEYPEVAEQRMMLHKAQAQLAIRACSAADLTEERDALRCWAESVDRMTTDRGVPPEYLGPRYTCPICDDKGSINGRICGCKEALLRELASRRLSDQSASARSSFEGFSVDLYPEKERSRMARVLKSCRRYVEQFGPGAQNLLFWGGTGLGKTHLSLAIADAVVRQGRLVLYASAPHLMGRLEQQQFGKNQSAEEYRRMVFECDLLIIDDLGAEFETRFAASGIYDIINSRLNEHRPMIINTNLDMRGLRARYGERTASRLQGCFAGIHFAGPDIRLLKYA